MRARGLVLIAVTGAVPISCAVSFPDYGPEGGSGGATSTSTDATTTTSTSAPGPAGTGGGAAEGTTSGAGGATSQSSGPTTTGSGGGGASSASSGGGGGSTPCRDASGCDDDNPCTTDVCNPDGACDHVDVDDGPLGGTDDPNDCQNRDCVGGDLIETDDDGEDPSDANPPCELTICVNGTPTPDFAEDGTSCGAPPLECDGAGVCAGCDPDGPDTQCGAVTQCSSPSCGVDGTCNPGFLDEDTALTDTVDGDCRKPQCTGDAVDPANVDDDSDVPADTPCGEGVCAAGSPGQTPLAEGMGCTSGIGVCDGLGTAAGNCKACRDTAAGVAVDAGCTAGALFCDEAANAGAGQCRVCVDSAVGAGTDLGCAPAQVCDAAGSGACVDCYTDGGGTAVNCAADQVCEPVGLGDCSTCYDLGPGTTDAGCDASTPACDDGNDTCEQCQDDADCVGVLNGPDCSQGGATACGCNANSDCSTSNQGHFCRAAPRFCGCNTMSDCSGIPGATACTGNVCFCNANPCQ